MIRSAEIKDARAIAELVIVVLKDMEVDFLTSFGEKTTVEVLEKAVLDPTYRYGYPRGIVKEINGEVAGITFGYLAEEEAIIDQGLVEVLHEMDLPPAKIFTDLETYPEEWYLDMIVVNEKYRGLGIGTQLLEAVNTVAKEQGANKIGLCVDFGNPQAQKLYKRQGFKVVGEQVLSGHDYYHLQRIL